MNMTIEQLYEIILAQQEQIGKLTEKIQAVREVSDLNDYWLREMIDALTESVDNISENHCCCEKYHATRNERKAHKKENPEL